MSKLKKKLMSEEASIMVMELKIEIEAIVLKSATYEDAVKNIIAHIDSDIKFDEEEQK